LFLEGMMNKQSQSHKRRPVPAKRQTVSKPQSAPPQEINWIELGRTLGEAVNAQGQAPLSSTDKAPHVAMIPDALAANPQFAEIKQSITNALASIAQSLQGALTKTPSQPPASGEEPDPSRRHLH
jgi:hypothetical protein